MKGEVYKDALAYLNYVRDISRKLSVEGLENVLVEKNRKGRQKGEVNWVVVDGEIEDFLKFQENDELKSGIKTLKNDEGLFVGYGAVYGRIKNRKTKIGGPILVSQILKDEESSELILNDEFFVNYDLFATLVPGNFKDTVDEETEETNEIIQKIENFIKIVEEFQKSSFENKLDFAEMVFDKFVSLFDINKHYYLSKGLYKSDFEPKENELLFTKQIFFFKARIPHELTVYNSINSLIEELESKGSIDNEVLSNLLNGLFQRSPYAVRYKEEEVRNVQDVIEKYIPISLSDRQKEAIVRAFTSPISYVQGPPGTGKSHTITVMAIVATLLKKKVLIVSSKEPAVKVVKEKLDKFLGDEFNLGDSTIPYYLYLSKETRNELKQKVSKIASIYDITAENELKRVRKVLMTIEDELEKDYSSLKNITDRLNEHIELQKRYINVHDRLTKHRDYFIDKYRYDINYDRDNRFDFFPIERSYDNLKTSLEFIKALRQSGLNTYKTHFYAKFLNYIKQKLTIFVNEDIFISRFAKISLEDYLQDLLELVNLHIQLYKIKSGLDQDDPEELRKSISNKLEMLNKNREEYIKQSNIERVLSLIKQRETKDALNSFKGTLHWKKADRIRNAQQKTDYDKLIEIFPIWICQADLVNGTIPMKPNLFDLVIVDEASQVNLAEIMPIMYRGKALCVIGDHKQLNLISTGLPLNLSSRLDKFIWSHYIPGNISYDAASQLGLTVTKSSILDLIKSEDKGLTVPSTTLDEHYRSLPLLARFTSDEFYEKELKIMTETPDKVNSINQFMFIKIENSKRDRRNKYSEEEAVKVLEILESLKENKRYRDVDLSFVKRDLSIGVISPLRGQVGLIKYMIEENKELEDISVYTPEEAQGHEFDVSIISLCLNEDYTRSKGHYEDKRRFNVMTSRAKYFTFLVSGKIPSNFYLTKRYIKHFGYDYDDHPVEKLAEIPKNAIWRFDENKFESNFERAVYDVLREYSSKRDADSIEIYNQVVSCGRRLDFVVYSKSNQKYVAVEVDGIHHFKSDGRTYNEKHIERIQSLKRAGWNIINTQYYKWYDNFGRPFGRDNIILEREIDRIYKLLDRYLFQ